MSDQKLPRGRRVEEIIERNWKIEIRKTKIEKPIVS